MAKCDESLILISSSPEFPSLCDLIASTAPKKQPALCSGNSTPSIPDDAPSAFTGAASTWHNACYDDDDGGFSDFDIPSAQPPRFTTTASLELSPDATPFETVTKRPESPEIISIDDSIVLEVSAPKKRGRKPKEKQDTVQTTIPKSKVTKPAGREKVTKKTAETVSNHFPPPAPKAAVPSIEDEVVVLEPALARRLDWTPPRDSVQREALGDSSALKEIPSQDDSGVWPDESPPTNVFRSLRDNFAHHNNGAPANETSVPASVDILGKRKLIELVNTSTTTSNTSTTASKFTTTEVSPVKQKAPKKKPRTITDLAMAAYRPQEEVVIQQPKQDSLLGYLEVVDDQRAPMNNGTGTKTKTSKRTAKPEPRSEVLLSPTSAMRQVSNQDFVFGTASQLATEDDPDLLRALHEAMKLSNEADNDIFLSSSPVDNGVVLRRKSRGILWKAGARDEEGELLELEVLDLTGSSPASEEVYPPLTSSTPNKERVAPAPRKLASLSPPPAPAPANLTICARISSSDICDLANFPAGAGSESPLLSSQEVSTLERQPLLEPTPLQVCPKEDLTWGDDFDSDPPPPSNQEQHFLLTQSASPRKTQAEAQKKIPTVPPLPGALPEALQRTWISAPEDMHPVQPAEAAEAPPRPKYELYTDAQLARDVSKYGFKPVKKRTAMIALLDQCWTSKQQTSTGGAGLFTSAASTAGMSTTAASQSAMRHKSPRVIRFSPRPAPPRKIDAPKQKTAYAKNTVLELKKFLQERGLKISGTKPVLISRLEEDDQNKVVQTVADAISRLVSSPAKARSSEKTNNKTGTQRSQAIEIPDSDLDLDDDGDPFISSPTTPTHARKQGGRNVFSPPDRERDSDGIDSDEDSEEAVGDTSLMEEPTTQQLSVFSYITKAVTSAPRTTDPKNPSWHEKMLMYDPVILEELAAWLNSGPLGKVGYDGNVAPVDVKSWCESKSVHYLWKISNKGRDRKRY